MSCLGWCIKNHPSDKEKNLGDQEQIISKRGVYSLHDLALPQTVCLTILFRLHGMTHLIVCTRDYPVWNEDTNHKKFYGTAFDSKYFTSLR